MTQFKFAYRHNGSAPIPLRWGLDARSALSKEVRALLDSDSPAADLWWIAGSCFAVDRDAARPALTGWRAKEPEWRRSLAVHLPVRQHDFWTRHGPLVEKLLGWLTGDAWTLTFDHAAPPPAQEYDQLPLFYDTGPVTALFSGGLDSTAGLAVERAHHPEVPLRLVTVVTNKRQQRRCNDLLKEFSRLSPGRDPIGSAVFHLAMMKERPRENSARTRGFVFLSAAVATAVAYESPVVRVYENGTGALNLACSRGQVGAQSARPVHPRTLALMQRIARAVADHPTRIENPFATTTKAELVTRVPTRYDGLLNDTVSCDTGFSRRAPTGHCGACTSCLLRLQSIVTSGKNLCLPEPGRGSQAKRTHPRAMLWQVHRLRHALRDGPSWEHLVREFPDVVCAPGSFEEATRRDLLGLFARYAREWQNDELSAALDGVLGGEDG